MNEKVEVLKETLLSNPKVLASAKAKFEHAFGSDSETRKPKQWRRLVRVYGMATVCETEKLTKEQVKIRCSGRKV